ncbi:recombinase family protein [bacterium]|nr:recombinase family protein [bacterium]
MRNRFGKKIARSIIYRIFVDPFYYGKFEYLKNSGNWYQGKHEPMITEEEYNHIQTLLSRDNVIHPKNTLCLLSLH